MINAMKQWLEALDFAYGIASHYDDENYFRSVSDSLRKAIEE